MAPETKPSPKPPSYGEPEKPSWVQRSLIALFFAVAVGIFVWGFMHDTGQKRLVCEGEHSMTSMGTCHEE